MLLGPCDWYPKIIPSSAIAGYLTTDASEHLGLRVGLRVIAGAADTAASSIEWSSVKATYSRRQGDS